MEYLQSVTSQMVTTFVPAWMDLTIHKLYVKVHVIIILNDTLHHVYCFKLCSLYDIIVRPCSYDVDECDGETTAYNNSIDCNCELVNGPNNTCEGM